jgi:hypothetical protein
MPAKAERKLHAAARRVFSRASGSPCIFGAAIGVAIGAHVLSIFIVEIVRAVRQEAPSGLHTDMEGSMAPIAVNAAGGRPPLQRSRLRQ